MSSNLKIILCSVCVLVFNNFELAKGFSKVGVKNFHSFSNDLIIFSNKTAEAVDIKPGVKLFSPFGVGYLLATIHGKLWDVPTNGINEALGTPQQSIVDEYSVLLQEFNFQSISTSNVVYTRYDNVTRQETGPVSKLNAQIKELDFVNEPEKFWSLISEQVGNGTNEQIKDELIPEVMWQKIFENSTQGAFVNTLYHKSHWDIPWQDIGEKSFNYDTIVKFYEQERQFPVFESENFSAIQVELQNNSKQIVFVKPHSFMDLSKIREVINEISTNSGNKWTNRKLKLQIPALNVTNLSRNHQGLVQMGISDAFCRLNASDPEEYKFELQPIAQANHFEFSGDFIEFASATGAIINYNKYVPKEIIDDAEEEHDEEEVDDYQNVEEEEQEEIDIDFEALSSSFSESRHLSRPKIKSNLRKVKLEIEGECEKPEEFGKSHRKSHSVIHDTDGKATLIFDTPFFYFVQDNQLGEIFSGVINSLCQYNRVSLATKSSTDHAWLHDVFKVAFWKCV